MKRILCSMAATVGCLFTGAAFAETHALIMAISEYRGGAPALKGVPHDVESARQIARGMGVKDAYMYVYRDNELTVEGIDRALNNLHERLQPGDQAFIYFTGHGMRTSIGERCAEALVAVDSKPYPDVRIEEQFARLSEKARKLIVLVDACHSGGAATRSLQGAASAYAPKYFNPKAGGGETCSRPVNILTRSIRQNARYEGKGANNYVYIAASRDNEVALDNAQTGGLATVSWRDCLLGAAVDRDGSGALSADEVSVCAQQRINQKLVDVPRVKPHHVTIVGNRGITLTFATPAPAAPVAAASTPAAAPAPAAAAAVAAPPPAAPVASVPPPAAAPAHPPAYYTLQDIYHNRDDRRVVQLKASRSAFRIGVDEVEFSLASTHAGHVYLLMVGTDGKTFDMLFPNKLDGENRIAANQQLTLPRASWAVKAGGPPGRNHLLAIVSESPRDFSKAGMQAAGPFSIAPASAAAAQGLQAASGTSANAGSAECASGAGKRSLQVVQRCSDAYGAALLAIDEVQ